MDIGNETGRNLGLIIVIRVYTYRVQARGRLSAVFFSVLRMSDACVYYCQVSVLAEEPCREKRGEECEMEDGIAFLDRSLWCYEVILSVCIACANVHLYSLIASI